MIAENPLDASVRLMTHPYWGTVYCPEHEEDATRRCDGCDRLEARGGGGAAGADNAGAYAELPDGRALCLECASTVGGGCTCCLNAVDPSVLKTTTTCFQPLNVLN